MNSIRNFDKVEYPAIILSKTVLIQINLDIIKKKEKPSLTSLC